MQTYSLSDLEVKAREAIRDEEQRTSKKYWYVGWDLIVTDSTTYLRACFTDFPNSKYKKLQYVETVL